MTRCALRALAVAGLAACATSAQGVIVLNNGDSRPLDVILGANNPDHQIQISDKVFTFVSWTSVAFPTSTISISAFTANNPLLGTGFDITGGFGDVMPNDPSISEFNLRYTVEVLPAYIALGYRIIDSELTFNGSATGPGSYARVDESLLDANGVPGQNLITTSSVAAYGSNPGGNLLQDHRVFGPPGYTKIEVNKDVQFFANAPGGTSSASFVRQSFSQIPSPGGAALMGIAGLLVARRRR
jgi:hypothetical protein